ncbi:hypothetical protein F518_22560 [Serratia marcescens VGH107]|nr:hypothetical protein F518_22560 [Serratia marcescens VGH107]
MLRLSQHLPGVALFDDLPVDHKHHPIRRFARKADFMRDDHQRDAQIRQSLNHVQHFTDQLGIERGGRLIEQDHLRVQRQRARDGDALLLAAGEVARIGIRLVAQPDGIQQLIGHRLRPFAGVNFVHHRRFDDVFQHRQVREQVEVLEHVADVDALPENGLFLQLVQPVALAAVTDVVAVDADKALVHALQVVDRPQQRRFARAGRAEDHGYGAWLQRQADVVQRLVFTEKLADVADFDQAARRHRDEVACRLFGQGVIINGFRHAGLLTF